MGAHLFPMQGPQVDEFKRTIKMFLAGKSLCGRGGSLLIHCHLENSPRVQRTPRTSDSGSLPFLTFDNLRNGAATSFVPVGSSSTSAAAAEASSPAQAPEGQDAARDYPPPIPPTYAHPQYQVPLGFAPPPQHQQLPGHPIQPHPLPHTLPPIAHPHDPSQLQAQAGIPLDPALAIDPALEDANMQTLAPVLAQLGVIGRLRPVAPEQQQDHAHVAVGYTVSHDRGTPPATAVPPTAAGENALHNIGVRVLEVLIAGGKPVEAAAVRAWAGVIGASPAWGEVVVEIVGATRAEPGTVTAYTGAPPENLDQLGVDALRACALMCLGLPGAEEVLAKRLEEPRWGEDIAEAGEAENWQRASEVFVGLAGAGIAGAAEAVARLEAKQGKSPENQEGASSVKAEDGATAGDVVMEDKATPTASVVPPTLNASAIQADSAVAPAQSAS